MFEIFVSFLVEVLMSKLSYELVQLKYLITDFKRLFPAPSAFSGKESQSEFQVVASVEVC